MPFVLSLLAAFFAGLGLSELGAGERERALAFALFVVLFAFLAVLFYVLKLQDRLELRDRLASKPVAVTDLITRMRRRPADIRSDILTRQIRVERMTQLHRKSSP